MSRWTHVVGCLYVDTYTEKKDIKGYVEKLLSKAPKITGSERDCDIFVNPLSGHNTSVGMDCEHCPHFKDAELNEDGKIVAIECDAEDNFKCPTGEYQTCVAITIIGNLRDRDVYRTTKEIDDFIRYIQSLGMGFTVDYPSVFVRNEWDKDYVLTIEYDKDNWEDKGKLIWVQVWKGDKKE